MIVLAGLLPLALVLFAGHLVVGASTVITVTTMEDEINNDGDCSLREAILAANDDTPMDSCPAGLGADEIFIPGGFYSITIEGNAEDNGYTGDFDIWEDLSIIGASASTTILSGNSLDRILHIQSGITVTISHLAVQDGYVTGQSGGGIRIQGNSRATLDHLAIRNNFTEDGGGGVFNQGAITITHSAIYDNAGVISGGGIYNYGWLVLTNSTLSGNRTDGHGGGLDSFYAGAPSYARLNKVTVFDNISDGDDDGLGDGGGIHINDLDAVTELSNVLLAGNTDLGGEAPDCGTFYPIISLGYNLIQDLTGCVLAGDLTGNITGMGPLVGPLADYGGETWTHSITAGSPAIDTGSDPFCEPDDLRDAVRPVDGNMDGDPVCGMGAYEYGADISTPTPNPTLTTPTPSPTGPTPTQTPPIRLRFQQNPPLPQQQFPPRRPAPLQSSQGCTSPSSCAER